MIIRRPGRVPPLPSAQGLGAAAIEYAKTSKKHVRPANDPAGSIHAKRAKLQEQQRGQVAAADDVVGPASACRLGRPCWRRRLAPGPYAYKGLATCVVKPKRLQTWEGVLTSPAPSLFSLRDLAHAAA
jgi:hypothetical protein